MMHGNMNLKNVQKFFIFQSYLYSNQLYNPKRSSADDRWVHYIRYHFIIYVCIMYAGHEGQVRRVVWIGWESEQRGGKFML